MKKHVLIEVNDTEYRLRLSLNAQRKLQKKHDNVPASALCLAACDDAVLFSDLLGVCLDWPESGNPKVSGGTLYEEMVETGVISGMVDRTKIVAQIMVAAGLTDEAYGEAITEGAQIRRAEAMEEILKAVERRRDADSDVSGEERKDSGDPLNP